MSDQLVTVTPRPAVPSLAWQVGAATLARFFLNTSRRFIYAFAPALSRGLNVPLTSVTSMIAVNQVTGILSIGLGPLIDRWGYRTMLLAALGMLVVGMLAAGFLPFYGTVLLALFLAGLGKSIFDPALQAYIGKHVSYQRRGLVIGVIEFGWAGSSLIGVPLIGLLIAWAGWRSPFFMLGALGLLSLIALSLLIPPEPHPSSGVTRSIGFRQAWRLLWHERAAMGVLGYGLLAGLANDNLFIIYGVWLEEGFGLGTVAIGLATTVIGVAELLGEGLTASIADRFGLKRAVVIGLALSALSYLGLSLVQDNLTLALAGLFVTFATFEFAIVTSISLITELLPEARATMMSSFMGAVSLGRVIGAFVGGLLWLAGGLMAVGLVSAFMSGLALACLLWGLHGWQRR